MKKRPFSIILATILASSLFSCAPTTPSTTTEESLSDPSTVTTSEQDKTNIKKVEGDNLNNIENKIIKWEGRYEYKEKTSSLPDMMLLYHTATGFTVEFYGSKLEVDFFHAKDFEGTEGKDIYYDVKVDDEVLPNTVKRRFKLDGSKTRTTVTIASGLSNERHVVTVLKTSEPADAYTGVVSISTDGYFYKRDINKDNDNLKFMAVCASGGSGYGVLSYNEKNGGVHSRSTKYSSSLHSFNYLTARMFGADISFCAQAGWGVKFSSNKSILDVIDKTGITPTNNVAGAQTTADWDYNLYVPDVIIFNIGGNDTKKSDFDVEIYQEGVIDLVTKLHGYYPEAKMLWTHTQSKAGQYAITALKNEGIINEGYIKQCVIPGIGEGDTGNNTWGASDHQSLKTHIDSSNKIVETLERWGFTTVNTQISFSDFEDILQK